MEFGSPCRQRCDEVRETRRINLEGGDGLGISFSTDVPEYVVSLLSWRRSGTCACHLRASALLPQPSSLWLLGLAWHSPVDTPGISPPMWRGCCGCRYQFGTLMQSNEIFYLGDEGAELAETLALPAGDTDPEDRVAQVMSMMPQSRTAAEPSALQLDEEDAAAFEVGSAARKAACRCCARVPCLGSMRSLPSSIALPRPAQSPAMLLTRWLCSWLVGYGPTVTGGPGHLVWRRAPCVDPYQS